MPKILLVEDDKSIVENLTAFLAKEGFEVNAAKGQSSALSWLEKGTYDLVLLDVSLADGNGFAVCSEIKSKWNTPVIFLTASGDEYSVVAGFDVGADDYVSKPFSPKILVARVNALLRRTSGLAMDQTVSAGGIEIDKAAHIVKIDGNPVDLSFKEFELLTYIMENQGIALSREKILNNVWNYDYFGDARTIDTHVKKLRNKLGDKGEYIRTIWGMGYKFEVAKS